MMNQTPLSLGFRLPAEWEPHSAVWLAWPHDQISFPGRVEKVEHDVVTIILAIHQSEQVELLVLNDLGFERANTLLRKAGVDLKKITFRIADYVDGWMRDCGPVFVKSPDGKLAMIKWIFNQWGGKFPDLLPDDKLPYKIKAWLSLEMLEPQLVLEGGAIDVNGQGLCLTTEQCVLNENRNLGKTKKDVEKYLADYLGVKKTIWLFEGLVNDHTDGHIDELARFVGPNKIVCGYEDNEKDENYAILKNNYETLEAATNLEGKPLEIIKLPMPHVYFKDQPAGNEAGSKAPVSYTNFYICNTVVLASIFNDPNDAKALEIIQSCFPDRKVVGIDCSDIIYGGGAIHCMAQQVPAI
ncbi:MAG: agmatine deiminase family protein [Candidatus Doudnabacteria bacterium]|nr:agmatine deiminase family protein [Candidatus Doudnabacteria bacterium]